MGSCAPVLVPPHCDGGQLGRSKRFCVVSGFPAVRQVTVIPAMGAIYLSRDEAAYRMASYLRHRPGIVSLLLRLHVRTYLGLDRNLHLFSDAAYVDPKVEYSYYEISFAKTQETSDQASDLHADISKSALRESDIGRRCWQPLASSSSRKYTSATGMSPDSWLFNVVNSNSESQECLFRLFTDLRSRPLDVQAVIGSPPWSDDMWDYLPAINMDGPQLAEHKWSVYIIRLQGLRTDDAESDQPNEGIYVGSAQAQPRSTDSMGGEMISTRPQRDPYLRPTMLPWNTPKIGKLVQPRKCRLGSAVRSGSFF